MIWLLAYRERISLKTCVDPITTTSPPSSCLLHLPEKKTFSVSRVNLFPRAKIWVNTQIYLLYPDLLLELLASTVGT